MTTAEVPIAAMFEPQGWRLGTFVGHRSLSIFFRVSYI